MGILRKLFGPKKLRQGFLESIENLEEGFCLIEIFDFDKNKPVKIPYYKNVDIDWSSLMPGKVISVLEAGFGFYNSKIYQEIIIGDNELYSSTKIINGDTQEFFKNKYEKLIKTDS